MSVYKIIKVNLLVSVLLICGCASALYILHIKRDNKEITIQYSSNIFLKHSLNKNVFIQIKNFACPQFTKQINDNLSSAFKSHNFKVIEEPIDAQFLLQVNIVSCIDANKAIVQYYIEQGYGSKIDSKQFGTNNESHASVIADLQISERTKTNSNEDCKSTSWKLYKTRVSVIDKKENHKNINDAMKFLIEEFSNFVVGVFIK